MQYIISSLKAHLECLGLTVLTSCAQIWKQALGWAFLYSEHTLTHF